MIVRAIDENNDWTFGKGKSDYRRDVNAVAQSIKTRLQSFLADCWFNESAGIDWWNLLGSKQQLNLKLAISRIILDTDGVMSLANTDFILNEKRSLTVSYSVVSIYGEISNSSTINIGELAGA